jgi:hypothetical protein
VFTSIPGDNSDLMSEVARLYFQPGFRIADVTFGRGVFWKKIDVSVGRRQRFAKGPGECPSGMQC